MESLAKMLLAILLILFFVLMCLLLTVTIFQGVLYIIYQRTERVHLSRKTYVYARSLYLVLVNQNEEVDIALLYSKHGKMYYIIGLNDIYRVRGKCFQRLSKEELTPYEKELIEEMKSECVKRVREDTAILTSFIRSQERQEKFDDEQK